MTHPAQEFGAWLKAKRKSTGIVLRVFAGRVGLSPAEYAEVEAGIVHWVQREQEKLILETLAMTGDEQVDFKACLARARCAEPLRFSDVYTREQLTPIRTRSNGTQLTRQTKDAILDAVFTKLS